MICTGWPVRPSRSHRLKVSDRALSTERAGTTEGELPNGVSAMSESVITAT